MGAPSKVATLKKKLFNIADPAKNQVRVENLDYLHKMAIPRSGTCPRIEVNLRKLGYDEKKQTKKMQKVTYLNTYQRLAHAEKRQIE